MNFTKYMKESCRLRLSFKYFPKYAFSLEIYSQNCKTVFWGDTNANGMNPYTFKEYISDSYWNYNNNIVFQKNLNEVYCSYKIILS